MCVLASLVAALGWTTYAVTFTSSARYLPSEHYYIPFLVLAIPPVLWAIYVSRGDWVRAVPRIAWLPLAAAVIAVLAGASGTSTLPGQAEYNQWTHQYGYSTRNGIWVTITRTQFLDATNGWHRLFLGVPLVFVSLAVAGSRSPPRTSVP